MTLVDTSAWIEFLRGTETSSTKFVRREIGRGGLYTTEPVLMELLAGARAGGATQRLERLLLSQRWLRVEPGLDYRGAVDIFHACRGRGHPIRSLNDCLIAAVALRSGVGIAHRDADFVYIAEATGVPAKDLRD